MSLAKIMREDRKMMKSFRNPGFLFKFANDKKKDVYKDVNAYFYDKREELLKKRKTSISMRGAF